MYKDVDHGRNRVRNNLYRLFSIKNCIEKQNTMRCSYTMHNQIKHLIASTHRFVDTSNLADAFFIRINYDESK